MTLELSAHAGIESDRELRAEVRRALSEVLEQALDPALDEVDLVQTVDYDSVTVLECVDAVEERFQVGIDAIDDDLRHTFRSVATIAGLLQRKLADLRALGLRSEDR